MIELIDFSRSKKDKTGEKRDTSEEKKPVESDATPVGIFDPVRK